MGQQGTGQRQLGAVGSGTSAQRTDTSAQGTAIGI